MDGFSYIAFNVTDPTGVPGNNTTLPDSTAVRPAVSLAVPATMFAAGVFGNLLALLVLSRSRREHKRTVFYRLVGGLAITDLFGTLVTSPVTLVIYANDLKWVGGQALCDYSSFMMIFVGFTTVFVVCSMAMDRFVALRKPYLYEAKVTYHKVKYILITMWGLAFIIACLPLIGLGQNVKHFPGTWCFFDFYSEVIRIKAFAYIYSIIGISMIITITALNTVVIATVWKMRQVNAIQKKFSNSKRIDSEIQMVLFLVGILAVFGICWAPLMVRVLMIQLLGMTKDTERDDIIVIRLASLNQILDPWVYLLFRRELFAQFFTFIKKKFFPNKSCSQSEKSFKSRTEVVSNFNTEKLVTIEAGESSSTNPSVEGTPSKQTHDSPAMKANEALLTDDEQSKLCS